MPISDIESKKSSQTFYFKDTLVETNDAVEWYLVSVPGVPPFYRFRNFSSAAEMKLTPQELDLVRRVVLGEIMATALQ